jgi:hypothetical protein
VNTKKKALSKAEVKRLALSKTYGFEELPLQKSKIFVALRFIKTLWFLGVQNANTFFTK